jgi:hypothetical protein
MVKLETGKARVALGETLENTFYRYRIGQQDPNILQRAATGIADLRGQSGGKLSYGEFKDAIDDALRNGDTHAIPEVTEAAQFIRSKVIDPWKDRAIKAGLLPEDVDPGTAASYMTRAWSKQKMIAERPAVVERFTDWLSGEQGRKASIKEKLTDLARQLDEAETSISNLERKAQGGTDPHIAARAKADNVRGQIEEQLKAWKGKSANEALSALKQRDKAPRAPEAPRLTAADAKVSSAMRRIVESNREMSRGELQSRANQIVDRILGNPDGRIPYDDQATHVGVPSGGDARGPLASREFMIPDNMIREFLNTDIEETLQHYLNTMVPDVMLTEKFGDVDMLDTFRKLSDEHASAAANAKTPKERAKLKAEYDNTVSDLAAIRDRIRGTYGFSSDTRGRNWGRAAAAIGKVNQMADLGGVVLTSIPDMAGPIFQYGLQSAFKYQIGPLIKMIYSPEMRAVGRAAKSEMKALGVAAESFLQMRKAGIGDIFDMYKPANRAERVIDKASNAFFLGNLLTPWTDFGKVGAGMVSMNEFSNAVEAVTKGTAKKAQIRKLAESGIDSTMASRIWNEINTETGSNVVQGVRITNAGSWKDIGARDAFEGALSRDSDMMVMTPGQERSLLMSRSPAAALILQYKTFVQAATERMLYRNMQVRDLQALQGFMSAIVLGMVGQAAYNLATDTPMPENPADWIKQGMSRSGVTGWLEEMNAISSKWTNGKADAYRLIGAGMPASRYQSRDKLGVVLGPTANKLTGVITAAGNAVNGDWTDADTRRLRRLAPAQNLFYIRRLLDGLEGQ